MKTYSYSCTCTPLTYIHKDVHDAAVEQHRCKKPPDLTLLDQNQVFRAKHDQCLQGRVDWSATRSTNSFRGGIFFRTWSRWSLRRRKKRTHGMGYSIPTHQKLEPASVQLSLKKMNGYHPLGQLPHLEIYVGVMLHGTIIANRCKNWLEKKKREAELTCLIFQCTFPIPFQVVFYSDPGIRSKNPLPLSVAATADVLVFLVLQGCKLLSLHVNWCVCRCRGGYLALF